VNFQADASYRSRRLTGDGSRDLRTWLRESTLLIAECTCPSLGVGYELAYAESYGKPCHIFYNRSKGKLSAMLTGNQYFHIHPYEKEEDIYASLEEVLQ